MFDTLNDCHNSDVRYGTVRNKTDYLRIKVTFRRVRVTITIVPVKAVVVVIIIIIIIIKLPWSWTTC